MDADPLMGLMDRLSPMKGLIAHRVRALRRDGNFLGFRLASGPDEVPWIIRIDSVAWRVEQGDRIVVGARDDVGTWVERAAVLNGRRLVDVAIVWPSLETAFRFGDLVLRVMPVNAIAIPQAWSSWGVRTPAGERVRVGPGSRWTVEPIRQ